MLHKTLNKATLNSFAREVWGIASNARIYRNAGPVLPVFELVDGLPLARFEYAATMIFGDRYGGWIRDQDIVDWLRCAEYSCRTYQLQSKSLLHVAEIRDEETQLVGVVPPLGEPVWLGVASQPELTLRIAAGLMTGELRCPSRQLLTPSAN